MQVAKLTDMEGGWFIGDFKPSILRTKAFEVALKEHKKNTYWPVHVQKKATEYNLIVEGAMMVNRRWLAEGDLFVIKPGEKTRVKFLENCKVVCVKVPSLPKDKVVL